MFLGAFIRVETHCLTVQASCHGQQPLNCTGTSRFYLTLEVERSPKPGTDLSSSAVLMAIHGPDLDPFESLAASDDSVQALLRGDAQPLGDLLHGQCASCVHEAELQCPEAPGLLS